jgi:RNA polymerase sigma-70 factor (ECF subfamily)
VKADLEALIQRVRRHDGEALAEYLAQQRRRLLVHVEQRLRPGLRRKVDADDIVQETGIEAVRTLPQTDLGDRDPFGWLCQIAERRIIDAHRRFFEAKKRKADREVPLGAPGGDSRGPGLIDLLVASMTTPSQAISRDHRIERFRQALAALPDEPREALRLRYLEGLPSKEVARRLNKSDGAVRVMLTRTIRRLQRQLG